jgi:hypothetical protein
LAEHCLVAPLQMFPATLLLQSASVEHWQKPGLAVVAAVPSYFAQVFSAEGQSLLPVQLWTHSLSTG